MKLLQEFKAFAMKGNVADMAVGIIIGAAFGKIVTSLVNNVLMPPIGLLIGGIDFGNLSVTIKEAAENSPAVIIRYGAFINTIIDFVIVSSSIFIVIKGINTLKRIEEEKPAVVKPSEEILLLTEIRDLLKK